MPLRRQFLGSADINVWLKCMAEMFFRLERNEIRDAENESRIRILEKDRANEGHVFRLKYHLGTTKPAFPTPKRESRPS
ncbi:hypothetical protein Tco_0184976 [Tanacetum coccineum]